MSAEEFTPLLKLKNSTIRQRKTIQMNLDLQTKIEYLWDNQNELADKESQKIVRSVLELLDNGTVRVAEPQNGSWKVNDWLKKTVLMSFKISNNTHIRAGDLNFYDKVQSKFAGYNTENFKNLKTRVVPTASVRFGSFIGENTVLMPSFVNIGAYVGNGTMVDTWATVGSCAQIGENVHLSGGVGIGGVLEPLQAAPTIIEDNCFIGARSEVVEGVVVKKNSVISMGVFIGKSTKILDRETGDILYGTIPEGSVVVSGSLPGKGGVHLYCAVIVKKVDERTRKKTAINDLLREE